MNVVQEAPAAKRLSTIGRLQVWLFAMAFCVIALPTHAQSPSPDVWRAPDGAFTVSAPTEIWERARAGNGELALLKLKRVSEADCAINRYPGPQDSATATQATLNAAQHMMTAERYVSGRPNHTLQAFEIKTVNGVAVQYVDSIVRQAGFTFRMKSVMFVLQAVTGPAVMWSIDCSAPANARAASLATFDQMLNSLHINPIETQT